MNGAWCFLLLFLLLVILLLLLLQFPRRGGRICRKIAWRRKLVVAASRVGAGSRYYPSTVAVTLAVISFTPAPRSVLNITGPEQGTSTHRAWERTTDVFRDDDDHC